MTVGLKIEVQKHTESELWDRDLQFGQKKMVVLN